jgi:Xaa-Pro aminopeptidase
MIERRQEALLERLDREGLDAMVVSDLANVRYLTGYVGTNGIAVLGPGRRLLLTDSRYALRARAQTRGVEVVQAARDLLARAAEALDEAAPGGRVAIEAEHMTVASHQRLVAALPALEIVPTTGIVEDLRVRKEPEEVAAMRDAAAIVDRALDALADRPLAGTPERDVAWTLEGALRAAGAEGVSFPIIVAAGANGAVPHHEPGLEPIPGEGLVVVDLGARVDGYASDCTRTFATGPVPEELERAYAVCREAQAAALAAVRPGLAAKDLDAVARDRIAEAGYGDAFGHGLGHGVGLHIHERPWVRRDGGETLEPGMVITIEPGIYLEGTGGVRIEDLVVVTEDGCEILSAYPKELQRR